MVPSTAPAITLVGLFLVLGTIRSSSAAPTSSRDGVARRDADAACVDDADFATKVGKKKRNCEWLGTLKKSKRTKQCQKKKAGFLQGCPLSCGACTATDGDTDGDAAVATCGKTYAEVSRARDEVLQDRYLSVGGKPLPNFEAPVVAYAHYTHCKGVVDAGKPEKATPMDTMHFEHCSVALGQIKDGKKMNAKACSAAFPHLKIAEQLDELGMGSSDMNDKMAAEYSYGFNYVFFDYGFTYSSVQVEQQGVDAIVAANFADVLMRRFKKDDPLTEGEKAFFDLMDGEKAGALNVQARMCQK